MYLEPQESLDIFFLGSTLSNLEVWPEIQRLGQNVGSSQIAEILCGNGLPLLCLIQCFLTVENVRPHPSPLLKQGLTCASDSKIQVVTELFMSQRYLHADLSMSILFKYVYKFLVLFGSICVMYVSLGSLVS